VLHSDCPRNRRGQFLRRQRLEQARKQCCWYLNKERYTGTTPSRAQLVIGVMTCDLWHQFWQPPVWQTVCSGYTTTPEFVRHFDEACVGQLKCSTMSWLQQLSLEILTYLLQLSIRTQYQKKFITNLQYTKVRFFYQNNIILPLT